MNSLSLLKNRPFAYYFLAALMSVLGEGIFGLAAIVVVLDHTGSTFAIGQMLVLTLLPSVLLTPFIGVVIDKYNRTLIAIICSAGRFGAIVLIPVSDYLGFYTHELFTFSILISYIFWFVLEPTKDSIIKQILTKSELKLGISFVQGAWQIGLLSSAIVAGLLIDLIGYEAAMFVASMTYIVAAFFFGFIKRYTPVTSKVPEKPNGTNDYMNEFRQGWRYLIENKRALFLVLATSMTLPFFYAINALIAPFNYVVLKGTGTSLGFIDSGAGIGSFISAAFVVFISSKYKFLLQASIILLSLSLIFFSLTSEIWSSFMMYVLVGFFIGVFRILSRTLLYEMVEEKFIGRVMTAITFQSLTLSIIVSLVISYIAERSILFSYIVTAGFISITIIFVALSHKQVKEEKCHEAAAN